MARLPRLNLPNVPQHIVQLFQCRNNRQVTFVEAGGYVVYLEKLKYYAKEYEVKIHAFVLMTNYVYLLATPTSSGDVSKFMQLLGRFYVSYFSQTYKRTVTLWKRRFKST